MAICTLCGEETTTLNHELEHFMIHMIKKDHPEWVESSGGCDKCVQYYKDLDNAVEVVKE